MILFHYSSDFEIKRKVLLGMVIPRGEEADGQNIPVQQRAMDRGGMYRIKEEFLPCLRDLDQKIREEFKKGHGHDLVKVSQFRTCNHKT